VRISVSAGGITIIREGHGTGEGRGASLGEVHDTALKAAETDATKRALATFGKPFGLALYRSVKRPSPEPDRMVQAVTATSEHRFHPDDTTPIPRPSRYYGRRQHPPINEQLRKENAAFAPPLVPEGSDQKKPPIEKNELTIAQPKRLRDKAHLKFVASQPCLICERQPADPHHLRFAQPRAMGLKVSDEFTVPLCRGHHRQLHQAGNEQTWWKNFNMDPLAIAKELLEQTHRKSASDGPSVSQTNELP